jgi:hypothetical protein
MANNNQQGNVPVPDPSLLTTEQLRRELATQNDRLTERIIGLEEKLKTRLDAMDKASLLLNENMTRVPTDTDKQIMQLRTLQDEKFRTIESGLIGQAQTTSIGLQSAISQIQTLSEERKKNFEISLATLEKIVNEKLDSLDKQLDIRHEESLREAMNRQNALVTALDSIEKTVEEKFASVNQRFSERDVRVAQNNEDLKVSITAALVTSEKVYNEKFESVAQQFRERDTRVEQTARDTKVAVDAALQAAKEATGEANKAFTLSINKSEAATTKQIDQLAAAFQTAMAGVGGQIGDVKERVGRMENLAVGRSEAESRQNVNKVTTQGSVGLWVAIAVAGGGFLTFLLTHMVK